MAQRVLYGTIYPAQPVKAMAWMEIAVPRFELGLNFSMIGSVARIRGLSPSLLQHRVELHAAHIPSLVIRNDLLVDAEAASADTE